MKAFFHTPVSDGTSSAVERQMTVDGAYDTPVPALMLSPFSAPSDLVVIS